MCGIVGFVGETQASPILLDGLERLEYRGYDSAGIAVLNNGVMQVEKTVERIKSLIDATENGATVKGNIGIGHTRWATHGAPSHANAHPHRSGNGKIAIVHNGIIENYLELKNELITDGVQFVSETDTEVVAHLLQKYYNGDMLDAVKTAVKRLEGSYALAIINTDTPDTLYAVRHFSPLIVGLGQDGNYVGSDVAAIIKHTKDVVYIDDGEIAVLNKNEAKFYDGEGNEIKKSLSVVDWSINAAEKGGYDHFMLKEIMEEPEALRKTIEPRIKNGEVYFEGLKLTKEKVKNIKRIVITACGSAYHTGIVAKYMFEEILRIPVEVDLASEFRYRNPIVNSEDLVIIISQSGETADTLAALKEAKSRGAHVLSIVNVVGSSIAKASDDVIYTWAGPEIAVATTKGYTTQLAVLYLFGIYAATLKESCDKALIDELISELSTLNKKIEKVLENKEEIARLSKKFCTDDSVFFIGRNIDYAVSLEGSLKLKEISYIHSEAYASGELKHGTISLIEPGRLVVALNCYEALSEKIYSNVKEVTARGAQVLATAFEGNEEIKKYADEIFYLPRTHPLLCTAVEIIPLQLFAYYMALNKGCDIDKPRNLAKSVTVE
ncbi:MAG: glutamine--fructose-6-phosphate transaminase (isomerizing) [Oscillospiraceae bacterium]|nr:glutamine--fructose-6-phosphate transaminase (isomerizing) [Candidatus Equicaccousia limihippi]